MILIQPLFKIIPRINHRLWLSVKQSVLLLITEKEPFTDRVKDKEVWERELIIDQQTFRLTN